LLTLSRDLPEIVETSLVVAALLCVRNERHRVATMCLVLAVLAKETALPVAMAAFLGWFFFAPGHAFRPRWHTSAIPLVVYLSWQGWLSHVWQYSLSSDVHNNVGFPLKGFLGFARSLLPPANHFQLVWLVEIIFMLCFVICVAHASRRAVVGPHVVIAWYLDVVLVFSLTRSVWVEDVAFLRAFTDCYVLGVLILMGSRWYWSMAVLFGGMLGWGLLAAEVLAVR
jgi:hypothetical protein